MTTSDWRDWELPIGEIHLTTDKSKRMHMSEDEKNIEIACRAQLHLFNYLEHHNMSESDLDELELALRWRIHGGGHIRERKTNEES